MLRALRLLVLLLPSVAQAADVVLLRGGGQAGFARKAETLLAAELRASGFSVVERDRPADRETRAALAQVEEPGAVAALTLIPREDGHAEVWLVERMRDKLVMRDVDLTGVPLGDRPADLALRAVELLRGSLLEVAIPSRTAVERETPAQVTRFVGDVELPSAAPRHALAGLGVSFGAALLTGGPSTSATPTLAVSYGLDGGYVLRLQLLAALAGRDDRAPEGNARSRRHLITGELSRLFRHGDRLQPFVGAGLGLQRLTVEGEAVGPLFPAFEQRRTTMLARAATGAVWRLGRALSLVTEFGGLVPVRTTNVLVANQQVARYGAGLTAGLGLVGLF